MSREFTFIPFLWFPFHNSAKRRKEKKPRMSRHGGAIRILSKIEAVIAPGVNSLPFAQAVLIPDSFMWLLYELERDLASALAYKRRKKKKREHSKG